MITNSLCAIIAAWLNDFHWRWIGIGMNRTSTWGVNVKGFEQSNDVDDTALHKNGHLVSIKRSRGSFSGPVTTSCWNRGELFHRSYVRSMTGLRSLWSSPRSTHSDYILTINRRFLGWVELHRCLFHCKGSTLECRSWERLNSSWSYYTALETLYYNYHLTTIVLCLLQLQLFGYNYIFTMICIPIVLLLMSCSAYDNCSSSVTITFTMYFYYY